MPLVLSGTNGISTNGINAAIQVTPSGHVLKPNQISFFARSNYSSGSGPTGDYVFGDVRHNVGGGYNSSTGRFTAPVAGYYYILASTLSRSGGYMNAQIRVNGSIYVYSEDTRSSNYGQVYPSAIVYLNVNDYVSWYVSYASYGSTYDWFGGFLVG